MTRIVEKVEIVPNMHKLVVESPLIAASAKPGQFVMVMVDAQGERVPFSLSDWNSEEGTFTTYVKEVGVTTMKVAKLEAGDELHAVVGPLGKPATIERVGTVVVGGGCYGIGAVLPLARAYKEAGNHVISIIEGSADYLVYCEEQLRETSDELFIGTSHSNDPNDAGKVHHQIQKLLAEGRRLDMAYFIGCTFMMMNCSNSTREAAIQTFVALNTIMLDGTGMCGCCRVTVGGETRFGCVDGPEFDGHEVDWKELFRRRAGFMQEEVMAYQHLCQSRRVQRAR